MTMLAELVEVVIGVDTHEATHTAAVVDARTGGVLGELTVDADPGRLRRSWSTSPAEHSRAAGVGGRRHRRLRRRAGPPAGQPRRAGASNWTAPSAPAARRRQVRPARRHPRRPRSAGRGPAGHAPCHRGRGRPCRCCWPPAAPRSTPAPRPAAAVQPGDRRPRVPAGRFRGQQAARHGPPGRPAAGQPPLGRRNRAPPPPCCAAWPAAPSTSPPRPPSTRRHPGHRRRLAARPARPARGRPDRRRHRVVRLVPPRPLPLRRRLRHARRRRPDPRLQRQRQHPVRFRLNRSGDRQLNRALHTVALSRLRCDPATRAYADRRPAEGKTDREIKRCLKRYIARELYRLLETPPTA